MKIEELRKIAKARTTGRWCYSTCYGVAFIETPDRKTGIAHAVDYLSPNNADAIVWMSNHIDALLDLWEAAQANQQYVATMPWRIDDLQEPHITGVNRNLFRDWCIGTSTQVDLALRKLEAVK